MLVRRLFANPALTSYLQVDRDHLDASEQYRSDCFYKVFPATVHRGGNQSPTIQWMYNHAMDGKGVVTPRDILDLVTRAKQYQQDIFNGSPAGESPWLIGPPAILYGLDELSKRRRETYLKAEFPHLWPHIEKFQGGKSEYSVAALQTLLGKDWRDISRLLVSVGFLRERGQTDQMSYWIPYLYRRGLKLTQGRAD